MSDPKDFLSRWSQRKRDRETDKAEPEKKKVSSPADASNETAAPPAPAPEFDITTLPSLDSITANSDIRAFLQRGVPASLTRAALRRAWSADPAIREFIGLSENAWDFNAPDSIPGFGTLNAEQVRQAVAQLFNELPKETNAQAPEEIGREKAQILPQSPAVTESDSKPDSPAAPDSQRVTDVASQQNERQASTDLPPPSRRHGGALPE